MSPLLLLVLFAIPAGAIECYTGLKVIAGQQVGGQTIKCDNSGAQCYNMTVAGGGLLDVMKSGCSMWRCMASRDTCISTTIKDIPLKFCCCGTHLCNIDKNDATLANTKTGGWNAEAADDGAVRRVLGSENSARPANLTAAEVNELLREIDIDDVMSTGASAISTPQ